MIIEFKSTIINQGKENKISFKSPVHTSKYQEFDVYEFSEPSKNEMNRIEVSDSKINIMAGTSTIELDIEREVPIIYTVQGGGSIKMETELLSLNKNPGNVKFKYTLRSNGSKIGEYEIELIIK